MLCDPYRVTRTVGGSRRHRVIPTPGEGVSPFRRTTLRRGRSHKCIPSSPAKPVTLSFLVKVSSFDQTLLWGKRMITFVRRRSHGLVLVDNIDVQALTTAFLFYLPCRT
jgi:hypothetical protein